MGKGMRAWIPSSILSGNDEVSGKEIFDCHLEGKVILEARPSCFPRRAANLAFQLLRKEGEVRDGSILKRPALK